MSLDLNFTLQNHSKGSGLKRVLPSIIVDTQAAVVGGRQIIDAILVASERMGVHRAEKKEGFLLKLDLEKAYDKVDGGYLDKILEYKGFGNKWRKWMVACISTTNFLIIINGRPRGKFCARRCLRQGDPLSPFLFTLIGDALSHSIHLCLEKSLLKGFMGKEEMEITHLQFADDTLIFCPNDDESLKNWWRIISLFSCRSKPFSKTLPRLVW